MRSILHVDMNNFYASVECLYRPEIRHLPVAVAGDPLNRHGIILAKNMIAKRLGVKNRRSNLGSQAESAKACYRTARFCQVP